MFSSSDGSEQKNHCFSGSGDSSSLTMKQAPSSVNGASGSRLNHVRSSQPIDSRSTWVPGSRIRAAAARLELAATARVEGPTTKVVVKQAASESINRPMEEFVKAPTRRFLRIGLSACASI